MEEVNSNKIPNTGNNNSSDDTKSDLDGVDITQEKAPIHDFSDAPSADSSFSLQDQINAIGEEIGIIENETSSVPKEKPAIDLGSVSPDLQAGNNSTSPDPLIQPPSQQTSQVNNLSQNPLSSTNLPGQAPLVASAQNQNTATAPTPIDEEVQQEEIRDHLQDDFAAGATVRQILHDHENISFVGQSVRQPLAILQGTSTNLSTSTSVGPVAQIPNTPIAPTSKSPVLPKTSNEPPTPSPEGSEGVPAITVMPKSPKIQTVGQPEITDPSLVGPANQASQIPQEINVQQGLESPVQQQKQTLPNAAGSEDTLKPEKAKPFVPSVRTYSSDVKGAVSTNKLTTSKIILAEQKRRLSDAQKETENASKKKSPINGLLLAVSMLFIVAGIGALAWYFISSSRPIDSGSVPTLPDVQERFITLDEQESVVFDQFNTNDVFAKIAAAQRDLIGPGKVKEIAIGISSFVGVNEVLNYATTEELFERLRGRMDPRLLRALGDDFVYGFYGGFENEPFLLIQVIDHDIAYSLMFGYEDSMAFDIHPIFSNVDLGIDIPEEKRAGLLEDTVANPAFDSAEPQQDQTEEGFREKIKQKIEEFKNSPEAKIKSPLPGVLSQANIEFPGTATLQESYVDLIVDNQDVRALYNSDDELLLLYGFIDRSNLIITADPKAFEEIVDRIRTKALIK